MVNKPIKIPASRTVGAFAKILLFLIAKDLLSIGKIFVITTFHNQSIDQSDSYLSSSTILLNKEHLSSP